MNLNELATEFSVLMTILRDCRNDSEIKTSLIEFFEKWIDPEVKEPVWYWRKYATEILLKLYPELSSSSPDYEPSDDRVSRLCLTRTDAISFVLKFIMDEIEYSNPDEAMKDFASRVDSMIEYPDEYKRIPSITTMSDTILGVPKDLIIGNLSDEEKAKIIEE